MPAYPQPQVRAAVAADAEQIAAIFAHYVATSVATLEEVAPAAAGWGRRLGDPTAQRLPFLVAEAGRLSAVGRKHGRWIDTMLMQKDLGPVEVSR